ncbi:MAG: hypothetical protein ABFQ95_01425 [Pseudomonadota bacterium]
MSEINGINYNTKLIITDVIIENYQFDVSTGEITLHDSTEPAFFTVEQPGLLLASETTAPGIAPRQPLQLPPESPEVAPESPVEVEPEPEVEAEPEVEPEAPPEPGTSQYVFTFSSQLTAPGTQAGDAQQAMFAEANVSPFGRVIIGNDIPGLFPGPFIGFEPFEVIEREEFEAPLEDEDVPEEVFVAVPVVVEEELCPDIPGIELILNNMDSTTTTGLASVQGPTFVDPAGNATPLIGLEEETRIFVDATNPINPTILLGAGVPIEVPVDVFSFVIGSEFNDILIGRIAPLESFELFFAGNGNDLLIGEKRLGIQQIEEVEIFTDVAGLIDLLGLDSSRYPGGDNVGSLQDSLHGEDCNDTIFGEYETLGLALEDQHVVVKVAEPEPPADEKEQRTLPPLQLTGQNLLTGGSDNDTIAGNIGKIEFTASGDTSAGEFTDFFEYAGVINLSDIDDISEGQLFLFFEFSLVAVSGVSYQFAADQIFGDQSQPRDGAGLIDAERPGQDNLTGDVFDVTYTSTNVVGRAFEEFIEHYSVVGQLPDDFLFDLENQPGSFSNLLVFAGDRIEGGDENDKIRGDFANITYTAQFAGVALGDLGGVSSSAQVTGVHDFIPESQNVLLGGEGDDQIWGNGERVTAIAISARTEALEEAISEAIVDVQQRYSGDAIGGDTGDPTSGFAGLGDGTGNDLIVGDVGTQEYRATAQSAHVESIFSPFLATTMAEVRGDITYGADDICGDGCAGNETAAQGTGNDTIWGDEQTSFWEALAESARIDISSPSSSSSRNASVTVVAMPWVTYGSDQIVTAGGENVVYGDSQSATVSLRTARSEVVVLSGEGSFLNNATVAATSSAMLSASYVLGANFIDAFGSESGNVWGNMEELIWEAGAAGSHVEGGGTGNTYTASTQINIIGSEISAATRGESSINDIIIGLQGIQNTVGDIATLRITAAVLADTTSALVGAGNSVGVDTSYQAASQINFGTADEPIAITFGNDQFAGLENNIWLDIKTIDIDLKSGPAIAQIANLSMAESLVTSRNVNINFGDDVANFLEGGEFIGPAADKVIYADFEEMILNFQAGDSALVGNPDDIGNDVIARSRVDVEDFTITTGVDTGSGADGALEIGRGSDMFFGEGKNITIVLQSGISTVGDGSSPSNEMAAEDEMITRAESTVNGRFDLIFQPEKIDVGGSGLQEDGNDLIVGDVQGVTLEFLASFAATGDGNLNRVDASATSIGSNITYGNDEISSGTGDDIVESDGRQLTYRVIAGTAIAGDGDFNTVLAEAKAENITIMTGDDVVDAGSGNDIIRGDPDILFEVKGGVVVFGTGTDNNGSAEAIAIGNIITLGSDIIISTGTNTVFADSEIFEFIVEDGTVNGIATLGPNTIIEGNKISFGDDTIIDGEGDSMLFGDPVQVQIPESISEWDGEGEEPDQYIKWGDDTFIPGAGNDIIDGGQGVLDSDTVSYEYITDPTQHVEVNLGDIVVINGGTFVESKVLGDTGDILETDLFVVHNDFSSIENITGSLGDDILIGDVRGNVLDGGDGADLLIGDLLEFKWEVIAGDNTSAESSNNSVSFGGDTLIGGLGNDVLIGDVEMFIWTIKGGTAIANGIDLTMDIRADASAMSSNNTVSFGDDILNAGGGDDFLIGDVKTFTWTIMGGMAIDNSIDSNDDPENEEEDADARAFSQENTLVFGNDDLNGGVGNDHLIGDVEKFDWMTMGGEATVTMSDPDFNRDATARAFSDENDLTFGDDDLDGAQGDDNLVGDVQEFNWSVIGGMTDVPVPLSRASTSARSRDNTITFGMDTLDGGEGVDYIIGDVGIFNWNLKAGMATSTGNVSALASTSSGNSTIIFGNDGLNGGAGNDHLVGDVKEFKWDLQAGIAFGDNQVANQEILGVTTNASSFENMLHFGNDVLDGAQGDDHLIGDVEFFVWSLIGGMATAGGNAEALVEVIASTMAGENTLTFGNDMLNAGDGNDNLIGDVEKFDWVTMGGEATITMSDEEDDRDADAQALLERNTLMFGDDELNGGAGNDHLVGDVELFVWSLTGGMATAGGNVGTLVEVTARARAVGSTLTFGNDMLNAGDGNDKLVGDVQTFNWNLQGGIAPATGEAATVVIRSSVQVFFERNMVTFGDDILNAGDGLDHIIGDVEKFDWVVMGGEATVTMSDEGFSRDANARAFSESNTLIFGDDKLNGGAGNDHLVGDVKEFRWELQAGIAFGDNQVADQEPLEIGIEVFSIEIEDMLHFGDDELDGAQGDDHLVGDVELFVWSLTGGMATADGNAGALVEVRALAAAGAGENNLTFGSDILNAGDGLDHIIGDVEKFDWVTMGGEATATMSDEGFSRNADARALLGGNTLRFGDDELNGGAGNDRLIGDVEIFSWSLTGGTSVATGGDAIAIAVAEAIENNITFGDDQLNGGLGNDEMWGDVREFAVTLDETDGPVIFENNSLTLGQDTFIFDLDTNFGDDVIGDFDTLGGDEGIPSDLSGIFVGFPEGMDGNSLSRTDDILQFATTDNTFDLGNLLAISQVVDDGAGAAKLEFDLDEDDDFDDASITFANIDFIAGANVITDYVDALQIVTPA